MECNFADDLEPEGLPCFGRNSKTCTEVFMERGVQYAVSIYVIKALPILYMYQEICKKEEMVWLQSRSCHFDFLNPSMPASAKILFIYFHLNASWFQPTLGSSQQ